MPLPTLLTPGGASHNARLTGTAMGGAMEKGIAMAAESAHVINCLNVSVSQSKMLGGYFPIRGCLDGGNLKGIGVD